MKIAVGLPNAIPATPGTRIVEWARRAEELGFSSLGTIGRIVFDNHEELIGLAAAAGATQRIGLASTVMIAPPREPVLLAKQSATLDAISGGRFSLGIGIGWRDDDFRATGVPFAGRGKRVEQMIARMRELWSGAELGDGLGAVGPRPARAGGPELMMGGDSDRALERIGRLADAFIATPVPPEVVVEKRDAVERARVAAGRERPLRLVTSRYFALGEDIADASAANTRAYYSFGGEDFVQMMIGSTMRDPAAMRDTVSAMEAVGADELFFWPTTNDLAQLDRLAEAVL